MSELKRTPLYDLHRELGGRIVRLRRLGDAGAVPGRHPGRAPALPRRRRAVRRLPHGPGPLDGAAPPRRWSGWCPPTSRAWRRAAQRYTQLTNAEGGILDDLIVGNAGDHLFLVVNAGSREADLAHLRAGAGAGHARHRARRPGAAGTAGARRRDGAGPSGAGLRRAAASWARPRWTSTASLPGLAPGYTGEDGFEISVAADDAERLARTPARPARCGRPASVPAIRCGWRPGCRLYGHDIDTTTSPVEAGACLVDRQAPPRGGRLPGCRR